MAESDVLSYAKKQRHARLLEKIRAGKGLTPSELTELEKYELMAKPAKKSKLAVVVKPRTPRQENFCLEYIKDFNGTQAAIRAGYSKKTANEQAVRLLANISVQKRISELKARAIQKTDITLKRVLDELGKIAFSNISDFLEFGPGKLLLKESGTMDRDVLSCIAEVSETAKRGIKFKLHDKAKALDSLKQYFQDFGSGSDEKKTIILPLAFKKN